MALLAMVMVGCNGDNAAMVSEDVACTDFANAYCGELMKCGAPAITLYYGDVTTCEMRLKGPCKSSLHEPGTTLTPNRLDACAQKLMAESCNDAYNHVIPAECKAVAGALADGTPCGGDGQCKNAFCKKAAGMSCGVCASRNGSCVLDADCDSGLVCAAGTCVMRVAAGGMCDQGHPCQYGLVCDAATCKTPPGTGMMCTASAGGGNCDQTQGNFCNPISNVCQAVGYAGAGQPCGLVNMGYTVCSANGHCSGQLMGNCVAAAADGAACNAANGPNCQLPAQCINSVCTLPDTSTCK
jgi:hypothetical protein